LPQDIVGATQVATGEATGAQLSQAATIKVFLCRAGRTNIQHRLTTQQVARVSEAHLE
jgi:hypothetical protein